jgi:NADH:ubiquinone oxidoreductase subunit 2 (subunit N)
VIVAALNSVVSLFYYFRIAKALFLETSEEDAPAALSSPVFTGVVLLLSAGSIYFFMAPEMIQDWANASLDMLGG